MRGVGLGEMGRYEELGIRVEGCRRRDEVCGRWGEGGGVRDERGVGDDGDGYTVGGGVSEEG